MPRQVYGKKSRAIYDPLAVFGSPQRSSPTSDTNEERIQHVGKASKIERDDERRVARLHSKTATVLKEKASNIVISPVSSKGDGAKQRHRGRRRIDDDDEDAETKTNTDTDIRAAVRAATKQDYRRVREQDLTNNAKDDGLVNEGGIDDEIENEGDITRTAKSTYLDKNQDASVLENTEAYLVLEPPTSTPCPSALPSTDEDSSHCSQLLEQSHHPLTDFSSWSDLLSTHFAITKIAEASFGEVYRLSLLEQLSGFSSNDESVFKIIALKPPGARIPKDKPKLKAIEGMSRPDDVANEVKLLQRMSVIPGFTNFRDVRVVKGRPPVPFAKAYKAYNVVQKARKKELSHFPDPAKKGAYTDDQLWAVIEMQDAGTDLECLAENKQSTSIWFVWDAFWQVVLSLAKGEEGAEFEHRDLHLGNICVRQAVTSAAGDVDISRKVNFTGLETTVIDYTISRALMQDNSTACQDLARDNVIFEGDSTDEYQYDIYRYMRGTVLANNPYAEPPFPSADDGSRSWDQYHPVTNLIWLHYVLYKLLEQVKWPSASKAPPKKQQAEYIKRKRAIELEHVLLHVQELLDPGLVCENDHGLKSASDLVVSALREGWLDVEDVVGEGVVDDRVDTDLVSAFEQLGVEPDTTDELVQDKHRARRKRV